MNDSPFAIKNWEKNKKFYLFCKCCGLILAPITMEGYVIRDDDTGLYCYGCASFFYDKYGFGYKCVGYV